MFVNFVSLPFWLICCVFFFVFVFSFAFSFFCFAFSALSFAFCLLCFLSCVCVFSFAFSALHFQATVPYKVNNYIKETNAHWKQIRHNIQNETIKSRTWYQQILIRIVIVAADLLLHRQKWNPFRLFFKWLWCRQEMMRPGIPMLHHWGRRPVKLRFAFYANIKRNPSPLKISTFRLFLSSLQPWRVVRHGVRPEADARIRSGTRRSEKCR